MLVAAVVVVVSVAGCSDEPRAQPAAGKALPGCGAFTAVLADQGMPSPRPSATRASATSVDCVFTPAAGSRAPEISYLRLLLRRPGADGFLAELGADKSCEGTVGADRALPAGSSCYVVRNAEGTAAVTGLVLDTGIRVVLRWTDPAATPDVLRTATLTRADEVADSVAAALFAA
ncbi:hypothetical protein Afe05nite_41060 [Paractinoplanes ferrugineus]|uniref:DUF3558 domain-containing protein n=1 Tax=Paractinoplanes ferrugineus TaxID=113564 RepID=A0A919J025_9ACTN|nr:hypothetical protein Afe05nite_41060 [Actinoplanes ferrugineus]